MVQPTLQQVPPNKPSRRPVNPDFEVPQWFIDNCVIIGEELGYRELPLVLQDGTGHDPDREQAHAHKPQSDSYLMDSAVYEPLLALIPAYNTPNSMKVQGSSTKKQNMVFSYNAVHVRLLGGGRGGGQHFLDTVVERFAQDAGADLVRLSIDDMNDLAEHFIYLEQSSSGESDPDLDPLQIYFGHRTDTDTDSYPDTESEEKLRVLKYHKRMIAKLFSRRRAVESDSQLFPFDALLSSPDLKRKKTGQTIHKRPLVIHLPNISNIMDTHNGSILEGLSDAVAFKPNAIIVFTSDEGLDVVRYHGLNPYPTRMNVEEDENIPSYTPNPIHPAAYDRMWEARAINAAGTNARPTAIYVVPIRNEVQKKLFDIHRKARACHEQYNIRLIQRAIRRHSDDFSNLPFAMPFTSWDFLEGSAAQRKLSQNRMSERDAKDLADIVCQSRKTQVMKEAILRMSQREEALSSWCKSVTDERSNPRWSKYPADIQRRIRIIEASPMRFKWELQFLSLLVNPEDLEEGWSDIALDEEVKESLVKLVHQSSNTGVPSYGVLQHGRVGGALLYGPPGTGKTHLARVLAREVEAVVICASAADIQDKWVGETEKAIKGLFSLGRMLAPSIIFIDEADSLFQQRTSDDRSWERGQKNQLLYEMDGLKKSKLSPFVLLATNFPQQLDHAVLRRVPSRIHMGLPSTEQRLEIFKICLRGETLDMDVNMKSLAERSNGYSGSDIQTVCVQAALVCETFLDESKQKRLLKAANFDKAFLRSAPTVSKSALSDIRLFAKDFDPAAMEKLAQQEHAGRKIEKTWDSWDSSPANSMHTQGVNINGLLTAMVNDISQKTI